MAVRKVATFELEEVIRLFSEGMPRKAIARFVGLEWSEPIQVTVSCFHMQPFSKKTATPSVRARSN